VNDALVIEPLPPGLIRQPLAWMAAEHHRCRQVCTLIDEIASSIDLLADEMRQALTFLRNDLPLHLADEDEDLFPMLRQRCDREDEVGRVIRALSADHRRDADEVTEISDMLDHAVRVERPLADSGKAQGRLRDFTARQSAHIALENAVVLPIARLRLNRFDLEHLSQGMAGRRNMSL